MTSTVKDKAIQYLKAKYTEDDIDRLIDQEICSGNWVDSEDLVESGGEYESQQDWYTEFGRGEAEDAVRDEIVTQVLSHLNLTPQQYNTQAKQEMHETIIELFTRLDT